MKKKGLIALLMSFVMMMSIMASACSSSPKTIEEYVSKDKDAMEEVQKAAGRRRSGDIFFVIGAYVFHVVS